MRKTEMRSLVWRKYTWEKKKPNKNIKNKRDVWTAQLTRTSVILTRWLRRTEQEYLKTEEFCKIKRHKLQIPETELMQKQLQSLSQTINTSEKPKSTRRKNFQKNSRDWFNNRSDGFGLESSLKWQSFFRGDLRKEEQGLSYPKELQDLQKQEADAHRIGKGSGSESRKPCGTWVSGAELLLCELHITQWFYVVCQRHQRRLTESVHNRWKLCDQKTVRYRLEELTGNNCQPRTTDQAKTL